MPRSPLHVRLVLALCILAVTAAPRAAHAQDAFNRYLTAAVRLYESLEYERAMEQLQRAKGLARDMKQDVAIALHEGIILADMGKREQSQTAFKTGLLLDPEAKLPLAVSPKVERDFEEMRARVNKELGRAPPPSPKEPKPPVIANKDRPEQQATTPDLNAPAPATPPPYVAGVAEPSRMRMPATSMVLAGVGVAALGVGTVFGLQSRSSVNEAQNTPFQDVTRSHWEDARSSANVANVLFGTAGLAAVGAVVTWVLSPKDSAPSTAKETQ
ncbi:hypothetical protein JRI60_52560 [Archangium violaceum]|uniref:hypothetical protein n=1 Tax=Archangium violaceum TaxID=83451 RepID=UPI001950789E|nr:hypothetical protein [Archangium violaceum]QRN97470.1 hypothetical protein JRI60_52560 [Archangium violaceum]